MLTDDAIVDRRIVAEAQTLMGQGHEVILLAGPDGKASRHTVESGLKIERWVPADVLQHAYPDSRPLAKTWRSAKGLNDLREIEPVRVAVRCGRYAAQLAVRMVLRALGAALRAFPAVERILPQQVCIAAHRSALNLVERWKLERLLFYRPDVVHAHDLPQLRVAAVAKEIVGVPLIYDAHELYPEIGSLTPQESKALAQIERRWIGAADAVITVNALLAEEFGRRYGIAKPQVIWNAIDAPADLHSSAARRTLRERAGLGPQHSVLLYQGWMSPHRGLQDLVQAMGVVDERIHLLLLGYGEIRDELERLAAAAGARCRVHFLDPVPHSELLYLTASADAGIIPYQPVDLNNRLCSPNKLFEYIQAKVPVIANDLPFLRQVIANEGFGVVAPLDSPISFSQAIARMFDASVGGPNRFRPRLISEAGRYSWAAQVPALLALYADILGRASHVPVKTLDFAG